MILSASRRTDLPRWYAPWLMERLRAGRVLVRDPVSPGRISRVPLSPEVVDCIVFWTKDPATLLPYLPELEAMGHRFYFQFTLTPYGPDLEPGLRDKPALIETFQALSRRVGRERVLWRYDPILFRGGYSLPWHREQFTRMCEQLSPFTESVTISFLDLYPRLERMGMEAPGAREIEAMAEHIGRTAARTGLRAQACAEARELTPYGIRPAACIDRALLERICGAPLDLGPAKSQRPGCGCCDSVDIGTYDTCRTGCLYCYADHERRTVEPHDPRGELLVGSLRLGDVVKDRACASSLSTQTSLF